VAVTTDDPVHLHVSSNSVSVTVHSTLPVVGAVAVSNANQIAWPGTAMFFAVGAGFGYWMDGVEARQRDTVQRLRDRLIASREARAEQSVFGQAERERLYAKLEEATRKAADE